jgi:cytochrome c2
MARGKIREHVTPRYLQEVVMTVRRVAAASALLLFVAGSAWAGGKELFESRCTVCHEGQRALGKNRDAGWWESTVERMRGKGADLKADEARQVVEYLSEVAGPKK